MLSANVMYLFIHFGVRRGRRSSEGSPGEEECWEQAVLVLECAFGAMRNLQAKQEQIDDSSKQKSAVWLAENWKLVRVRETNVHTKGDPGYGRLNFIRWLQQDLHSICSFSNVTLTLLP